MIYDHILQYLASSKKKRVSTFELENYIKSILGERYEENGGYLSFYHAMEKLIASSYIKPIGKKKIGLYPSLYAAYTLLRHTDQLPSPVEFFSLHPRMNPQKYYMNLTAWNDVKPFLMTISNYLYNPDHSWLTASERSLDLFQDEKWLGQKGKSVLRSVGLQLSDLNCFETTEPFFYRLWGVPELSRNVLIVENKDTFYTCKQWIDKCGELLGQSFDAIVYGEGNKIIKSFPFAHEVWGNTFSSVKFFYVGDLDPRGIWIVDKLQSHYKFPIYPLLTFYRAMISSGKCVDQYTVHREKPPLCTYPFLTHFSEEERVYIDQLFAEKRRIPQESVNLKILRKWREMH